MVFCVIFLHINWYMLTEKINYKSIQNHKSKLIIHFICISLKDVCTEGLISVINIQQITSFCEENRLGWSPLRQLNSWQKTTTSDLFSPISCQCHFYNINSEQLLFLILKVFETVKSECWRWVRYVTSIAKCMETGTFPFDFVFYL